MDAIQFGGEVVGQQIAYPDAIEVDLDINCEISI